MTVISLLSDELPDKPGSQEVIDLVSSSPPRRQPESCISIESSVRALTTSPPAKHRKTLGAQFPANGLGYKMGSTNPIFSKAPATPDCPHSSSSEIPHNHTSTEFDHSNHLTPPKHLGERTDSRASSVELAARLNSAKDIKDRITAYLRDTQGSEEEDNGKTDTVPDEANSLELSELESLMPDVPPFDESFLDDPDPILDAAEEPTHADSKEDSPFESESSLMRTDTIPNSSRTISIPKKASRRRTKPVFNDSTISDFPEATFAKPAVAATSITDRKKAARSLQCQLWTDSSEWVSELREEFENLEAEVEICSKGSLPIEGTVIVVAVHGTYEDVWSCEHQTFVKSTKHEEDLGSAIVVLKPDFMDKLGLWSLTQRDQYFMSTKLQISEKCCQRKNTNDVNIIFMIPELGAHYTRQVDKFNRDMRRRIALQSQNFVIQANEESEIKRPDEQFYTNLESELQIKHNLRAHYPRKRVDCVEMIANCVIDFGFQRYNGHMSQLNDSYGGSVRSKVTVRDVCIESLTQIQGLPPRIATSLIDEAPSLGRILETLGTNTEMRESRIKRFGKGNWNTSLLKFLQCDDPGDLI